MPFRILLACLALCATVLLSGSATSTYTVVDGSAIDEKLLSSTRLYGKGEQTLHSHIVISSQIKDEDCDKQWEVPFVAASSHALVKEEKIA